LRHENFRLVSELYIYPETGRGKRVNAITSYKPQSGGLRRVFQIEDARLYIKTREMTNRPPSGGMARPRLKAPARGYCRFSIQFHFHGTSNALDILYTHNYLFYFAISLLIQFSVNKLPQYHVPPDTRPPPARSPSHAPTRTRRFPQAANRTFFRAPREPARRNPDPVPEAESRDGFGRGRGRDGHGNRPAAVYLWHASLGLPAPDPHKPHSPKPLKLMNTRSTPPTLPAPYARR
jgi:hypothetical protein